MHWLLLTISILFVLAAAAIADPDVVPETATPSTAAKANAAKKAKEPKSSSPAEDGPPKPARMSPAEIRKMSDTYFKQCMNDWDAATHMTKKDWQRTCRRIADERAKFRGENM